MPGKLITVAPDGREIETPVHTKTPSHDQLREAVGGYPVAIKIKYRGEIRTAYVDEDGGPKKLRSNQTLTGYARTWNPNYFLLVGPGVIWVPDPRQPKSKTSK